MKKVLLPTDFSANAYNAITYAIQLLRNKECTFFLLNTYSPAVYQAEYVLHSPGQIGLGDVYQSKALKKLERLKEKLTKKFPNPKHTYYVHTANNHLADEVKVMLQNEKINLVVMGTQGATGAKEILFGTNTVRVLRVSQCPVVVVPPDVKFKSPASVLFPTDYKVDYKTLPLEPLLQILFDSNSKMEVIHIDTESDVDEKQLENKKKLEILLEGVNCNFKHLPSQELIDAINSFQTEPPLDFLVMVRNRHSFLERLFVEPVVSKIAFHVTIPFMVIPG